MTLMAMRPSRAELDDFYCGVALPSEFKLDQAKALPPSSSTALRDSFK